MKQTPVHALMSAQVTCVDSELGLDELAAVLRTQKLHTAPVIEDEGVLIGLVSKSDWERGTPAGTVDGETESRLPLERRGLLVEDVMSTRVLTVDEHASLADAVQLFESTGLHRVPVVAEGGKVVGMLSTTDVVRWLAQALAGQ